MPTTIILARSRDTPNAPPPRERLETRTLRVESLDGTRGVTFRANTPARLKVGATGLDAVPRLTQEARTAGVPGGYYLGEDYDVRPVGLPVELVAKTQPELFALRNELRRIVTGYYGTSMAGTCRIVGGSSAGDRQIVAAYVSGFDGAGTQDTPTRWLRFLRLSAYDPAARDLRETILTFDAGQGGARGLGSKWPIALSGTSVIGTNMPVPIPGDFEVWPRLRFRGPFGPNLLVTSDAGLYVSVPAGVATGAVLTVDIDPRAPQVLLDGVPAAGAVTTEGLVHRPFRPGANLLSVVATGATAVSRVDVAWRNGWEALWG